MSVTSAAAGSFSVQLSWVVIYSSTEQVEIIAALIWWHFTPTLTREHHYKEIKRGKHTARSPEDKHLAAPSFHPHHHIPANKIRLSGQM